MAEMTGDWLVREGKRALRSVCPQPVLNWREAQYYGRFGEVELHLVEFLCRRAEDAIDVGANDGCYVHFMRKHARRVLAFEPLPWLARDLAKKFRHRVVVTQMALSSGAGTAVLRIPVLEGMPITACSTLSPEAAATYPAHEEIRVPMATLDETYADDAGFIKIDVEGHEEAVLAGATATLARCRPRVLVEIIEQLSPGALRRITDFFRERRYRGFFVFQRQLLPIDRFDHKTMQRAEDYPDLKANLDRRQRFGRFLYNFLFFPAEEEERTFGAIRDRLARL